MFVMSLARDSLSFRRLSLIVLRVCFTVSANFDNCLLVLLKDVVFVYLGRWTSSAEFEVIVASFVVATRGRDV